MFLQNSSKYLISTAMTQKENRPDNLKEQNKFTLDTHFTTVSIVIFRNIYLLRSNSKNIKYLRVSSWGLCIFHGDKSPLLKEACETIWITCWSSRITFLKVQVEIHILIGIFCIFCIYYFLFSVKPNNVLIFY